MDLENRFGGATPGLRKLLWTGLFALLAACSSDPQVPRLSIEDLAPEILQVLPAEIDGFAYQSAKTYPTPWGYSLRYRLIDNPLVYADVFVYPVPRKIENLDHTERVKAMTDQALVEIRSATEQGDYSEVRLLDGQEFRILSAYTTRIDLYLVKDNLESFSLLFLTESNDKLLKVRMTMPDNYSNRNNENWQRFVESAFTVILENIDKA